ncbi:TetR/AcrR family transcriptional regulator [Catenulispora yoronensis]|uniref:TetR/AcrR family transcriptional regulator n=1 Tax=Catenulispora yoronensis TaxID=450799 RepID=A0ABP5FQT0_9ACTN
MEVRKERRAVLADAAIAVVAEDGMRALTHRAVDVRAALPIGTTSAYFRTRQALLTALVRRLAELDRMELEALGIMPGMPTTSSTPGMPGPAAPAGATPEQAAIAPSEPSGPPSDEELDGIAAGTALSVRHWLTEGRNRALARYRCLLETAAHPELRELLAPPESVARLRAGRLFERAGAADPADRARSYVAAIDGMILDLLLGERAESGDPADPARLAPAVRRLLDAHCAR